MSIDEVRREVRRVFGTATVEWEVPHAANAKSSIVIRVDGWPGPVAYRTRKLLDTLGRFQDSHGTTEEGDREICQALEESGAFISFAW
jgi:hypothetical protein